jgi:hypothetical protein
VGLRLRFQVRHLAVAVACCAVAFALIRTDWGPFVMLAVMGSLLQRWVLGGRGPVGGMLGGVVAGWSYCAYLYNLAYLYPQPNSVDYAGPFVAFVVFAFGGAFFGTIVGTAVWLILDY